MELERLRIGLGVDVHPFEAGRALILGGERLEHRLGLAGHSDADVMVHAVCDALLGAASQGDIGVHFPDSDPANRGRSSLEMLGEVAKRIRSLGYSILNIDVCVMAEEPKIAPHYGAMRSNMAGTLGLEPSQVGLKATTTEGLGFVGRGEGIAAQAVCLLAAGGQREEGAL